MTRTLVRAAQDTAREARTRTIRSKGLRCQRATPQRARESAAGAHAAKTGTVPRAVRRTPPPDAQGAAWVARARCKQGSGAIRQRLPVARGGRTPQQPRGGVGGGPRAQRVRRPGAAHPRRHTAPRPAVEGGAAPNSLPRSAGSRGPCTPQRGRRPARARARAGGLSPQQQAAGGRVPTAARPAHGVRRRAPPH